MNQKPSIGRIVHYVTSSAQHLPAVIIGGMITDATEVIGGHGPRPDTVDLVVFGNKTPASFSYGTRYDEQKRVGTYHWPERDEDPRAVPATRGFADPREPKVEFFPGRKPVTAHEALYAHKHDLLLAEIKALRKDVDDEAVEPDERLEHVGEVLDRLLSLNPDIGKDYVHRAELDAAKEEIKSKNAEISKLMTALGANSNYGD